MAIETIKEIVSIPKGPDRFIKISVVKINDDILLDIRQWVESERYTGPDGKKGITIPWDALNQIIDEKAFEQAKEIMDEA